MSMLLAGRQGGIQCSTISRHVVRLNSRLLSRRQSYEELVSVGAFSFLGYDYCDKEEEEFASGESENSTRVDIGQVDLPTAE